MKIFNKTKIFNNLKMYTAYLESCYQHIFGNTLIHSWGYFYYDLSGRCLQLMSDKALLDAFFKNDLFVPQIISNITDSTDIFYACDVLNDPMLPNSIKKTLIDKKYTYFFDIVNKQEGYTEIYTFATRSDPTQSNNFVLNNLDVLKMVSQDLAHRCRRLLTKENTFILPKDFVVEMNMLAASHQPPTPLNLKDTILLQSEKASKLYNMVNNSVFDFNKLPFNFMSSKELTLKEKEIIYLYYHGFNVYRIADILDISKRTVDKHFENIKRKLNCESPGQIIPTLLRSNISLTNFIKKL